MQPGHLKTAPILKMNVPVSIENVRLSNESFSCEPDGKSVIFHQLHSSSTEYGFQCMIVFEANEAQVAEAVGDTNSGKANTVYFQITKPYTKFAKQSKAEEGCCLEVSVDNYLDLYCFFASKWPLVLNQLCATLNSMKTGTDLIRIAKNLKFLHHGECNYQCTLGDDLHLTAKASSKKSSKNEFEVGVVISKPGFGHLELPLSTVTKLFNDTEAYHFLYQKYKGRQAIP